MAKSFSIIPGVVQTPFPPPAPHEIRLSKKVGTHQVGQTTQLSGIVYDHYNNPFAATVVWTSSNTSVATVNASGLVTFVGKGTVVISAMIASSRATSFAQFTVQ
jgi:uncharacterized protein YjdB